MYQTLCWMLKGCKRMLHSNRDFFFSLREPNNLSKQIQSHACLGQKTFCIEWSIKAHEVLLHSDKKSTLSWHMVLVPVVGAEQWKGIITCVHTLYCRVKQRYGNVMNWDSKNTEQKYVRETFNIKEGGYPATERANHLLYKSRTRKHVSQSCSFTASTQLRFSAVWC